MSESDIQNFLSLFPDSLMDLTPEEQNLSISLYHQLSKGKPVSYESLARASHLSAETVKRVVSQWGSEVHQDASDNIVGFFGLSLSKTKHRFRVADVELYTWCARDTLFIPALLDMPVEVMSVCPVTGNEIHLQLSPESIRTVAPSSAVLSLIQPDPERIAEDVTGTFCCHIHFFASKEVALKWSQMNPGTTIVSIEEGHLLGRRKNEIRYPDIFLNPQVNS